MAVHTQARLTVGDRPCTPHLQVPIVPHHRTMPDPRLTHLGRDLVHTTRRAPRHIPQILPRTRQALRHSLRALAMVTSDLPNTLPGLATVDRQRTPLTPCSGLRTPPVVLQAQ